MPMDNYDQKVDLNGSSFRSAAQSDTQRDKSIRVYLFFKKTLRVLPYNSKDETFLIRAYQRHPGKIMSIELPWSMKTLLTLAFTILAEMIIGSSCLGTTPSKSELENTISRVADSL